MDLLLIVDADVDAAREVADVATLRGLTPLIAPSSEEALAAIRDETPYGAVVDVDLPDADGLDLLSALNDAGVPTVAVAHAKKSSKLAGECIDAGAGSFVEKPFVAQRLITEVKRVASAQPHARRTVAEIEVPASTETVRLDFDDAPTSRHEAGPPSAGDVITADVPFPSVDDETIPPEPLERAPTIVEQPATPSPRSSPSRRSSRRKKR